MKARFWFKTALCELFSLLAVMVLLDKAGQWPFGARSVAAVALFALAWFGLKRVFLAAFDVAEIYFPTRTSATRR